MARTALLQRQRRGERGPSGNEAMQQRGNARLVGEAVDSDTVRAPVVPVLVAPGREGDVDQVIGARGVRRREMDDLHVGIFSERRLMSSPEPAPAVQHVRKTTPLGIVTSK